MGERLGELTATVRQLEAMELFNKAWADSIRQDLTTAGPIETLLKSSLGSTLLGVLLKLPKFTKFSGVVTLASAIATGIDNMSNSTKEFHELELQGGERVLWEIRNSCKKYGYTAIKAEVVFNTYNEVEYVRGNHYVEGYANNGNGKDYVIKGVQKNGVWLLM